MQKIISFYNKNREMIFLVIIIIVVIVGGVHILNEFVKSKNQKQQQITTINNTSLSTTEQIKQKQTEQAKHSAISEQKVSNEDYKNKSNLIDSFVTYCNNKQIDEAYNLLTDECKEVLYPSIEVFQKNYINVNFATYKKYTLQNYINNTYKIRLLEDMLSTGKSNNGEAIQDYFTIVNNKLNISEYIGRTNIQKEKINNNLTIAVYYKEVFMDYEIYKIAAYNGTENTIKLDSLESTKSIYVVNEEGMQYPSYSHEIIETLIEIPQNATRTTEIKFYCKYNTENQIKQMVFSDIILNYEQYKQGANAQKTSVTINM